MKRKEAIIRAATKLFTEKGFKETSIHDLSKLTGVAEGTIFYHFKNKEGLFLHILEKIKEDLLGAFDQYLTETRFDSGLEMMEGVISFYLYLAGMKEERFHLLHHRYPYELAEINPVCRDHLEAIYNCLIELFEKSIIRGQGDGSIAGLPARKTALILFALVDGLVRFKTYNLYDAGSLYNELIAGVRRMLENKTRTGGNP
jgi:AcrR family transcriptional regulator